MRRVFLIRAGKDAEQLDPMRHAGIIGLGIETVGDVRGMAPLDIEQAIAAGGSSAGTAALRSILQVFANDLRLGDLVVSPNPRRHEVWVAVVTGGYEYSDQPAVPHVPHTRAAEWLGWLDRDAAWMRDQLTSLDRAPLMYELSSREWWLRQLDSREFSVAPRTIWATTTASGAAKRSRAAAPSATTSRPATKRVPAAPKPPARKPPTPMVLCAGRCGLQWAPTSLVGGLCADCRDE